MAQERVQELEARVEQLSEALANTRKEVRHACYRLWDQNKTADEKLKRADLDLRRVHEYAGKALSGDHQPEATLQILARLEAALQENEQLKERVVELERELEAID